ncbi:MAG TPA: Stk1 family PASTA domain-containing Ser/Thr kinase [Tissierellaceae bacterium]|nr:Stk1 family PASTA domain-containing Ser/Thr kinase [Tissierellaceae bacterium]
MIGKFLGDRYEIIEKIGGGGMAIVYKAKCHLLNRFVAIKILRDEFIDDEEFIRKFKRESQAAASLSHPNVMNIYDVGVQELNDKNVHYIVMEYIKGKTLKDLIREKGKLSYDETIDYSIQIAEALKHAHLNHIVHRDIKPQNIMINEDNIIKVTDFGIARAATSSTLTTTSNVLGSVHYFSPEQARGGYTDEKSDIYSLGMVMYEMITGKLAYDGDTPISVALKHVQENIIPPRKLDATIPVGLEAIILKCVQKRQSDRYSNVEAVINDLRAIKNNEVINHLIDNDDGEQATRMIPIIKEERVDDMPKNERTKGKQRSRNNNKKGDGGIKMILLAILLAFLVVTIVFAGWLKLQDFFDVEEVLVPRIIGMYESEAREEIEGLGLVFNVKGTASSSEFEAGQVISQSVKEDSKVNEGFTIDVVLSEGKDLVRVPGLVNKTYEEAEQLLTAAGLDVGERDYEPSNVTPNNMVMHQEPEAFTYLAPGSKVHLIISKGEEIKVILMPDLIGMDQINAQNEIVRYDLVVGETKLEHDDTAPEGQVFWQSYEPGSEIETKTAVDIYISIGPEELGEGEGEEPPIDDPDAERTMTVNLIPFSDRDETEIKVFRRQDGVESQVYRDNHKYEDGEVTLQLRGIIGAEFDIYFDDIYQFTQTIEE